MLKLLKLFCVFQLFLNHYQGYILNISTDKSYAFKIFCTFYSPMWVTLTIYYSFCADKGFASINIYCLCTMKLVNTFLFLYRLRPKLTLIKCSNHKALFIPSFQLINVCSFYYCSQNEHYVLQNLHLCATL